MTSRTLKIITGVIQILFAIPFIGILVSSGIVTSIVMLFMHGVTIYLALREKASVIGNVLGLIATLLAIGQSIYFNSIGLFIIFYFFVLWLLHLLSAIFIFYGVKKDKKASLKQTPVVQSLPPVEERQATTEQGQQIDQHPIITTESPEQMRQQISRFRSQSLLQEKQRLEQSILLLNEEYEKGKIFTIDTSAVLQKSSLLILEYFLKKTVVKVYIGTIVVEELHKLKENDKQVRKAAEDALNFINKYENMKQIIIVDHAGETLMQNQGLSTNKDDLLIGSYLLLQELINKKALLLTNDVELQNKSINHHLEGQLF